LFNNRIFGCFSYFDEGVEAGPGATQLLKKLFVNNTYDVNSIPVQIDTVPIYVGVEFDLTQVIDLVSTSSIIIK
jgi:hypothetical protein